MERGHAAGRARVCTGPRRWSWCLPRRHLRVWVGVSSRSLLARAGVGGAATFAILALAFAGSFLAATGAASARRVLISAAVAGLVTAMPLWIPAGALIGTATIAFGPAKADSPTMPAGAYCA